MGQETWTLGRKVLQCVRAPLTACALLALVLGSPNAARSQALDDAGQPRKKQDEPGARPKRDARALRGPVAELEELLRQSGLPEDQLLTLSRLLQDDDLRDLVEEQQQVLRQLQAILGNPGLAPGRPGGGLRQTFPALTRPPEPRLGVAVSQPGATLIEQLELPKGQGLTLEEVRPDSAAAKAGLKPHDILLELDGKPVATDLREFAAQLAAVPANKPVDVLVLRRGRREQLKGLILPPVREPRAGVYFDGAGTK